ncbi:hypothetical protein LCGC14_1225290 [marine sediment metagenome]|uniref:Uncharacterized protein n=1 Tax=marine sediment metagenome TaxID=412755 RepID=A0A0F9PEL4_9ZZZZ
MNEAEVVSRICEHLQNESWQFWIDDHPIHKDLGFQKHCLLIGGVRPDIFGLNDVKQIFAVEVKGSKDYKKAIGQASDFKQFISILQRFDKTEITSKDIIDKLIIEYPNLFLNFFVKPTAKDQVVSMFLSGNKEILTKDYKKTISDFGQYNFFFAFKRHLVHLGILSQENTTFYKKTDDLDLENDYWILGKDILI